MLFQILELNYKEWTTYHTAMLTPGKREGNDQLALDRLLFNFLASAYAVTEQFRVSYKRRFRRNAAKLKEYEDFISNFYANSWSCAFFADLRDYAQHCGLPTEGVHRHESRHRIEISITQESATLLRNYKRWTRSKLTQKHGTLDLIDMTQEYYHRLRRYYGQFVAKAFYPELESIDNFYGQLTEEVRAQRPAARMVFLTENLKRKEGSRINYKVTFVQPPNSVFEELGITKET